MRTIGEVSRIAGISIRTLHYYDEIGLLKPARVTGAGYRLYDDGALLRLQIILLFRELEFPLAEIRKILDRPDFDASEAVAQQLRLLEMRREHLDELISLARKIQQKGGLNMDFKAFDQTEINNYRDEVRARWGNTEAFRASEQREGSGDIAEAMTGLFRGFGALRTMPAGDPAVQAQVAALQALITEKCYPCTNEILAGLGQMYTGDERFRKNIDSVGGEGTSAFAAEAIRIYCKSR